MLTGVAVIVAVTLAATSAPAEENDEKVPVKDLPKNVVAIVKVVCPEGTILSAEKEVQEKDGRVTVEYDVKVRQADGKVVAVEVVLDKGGNIRKVQVGEDDDDEEDDKEDAD